MLWPDMDLISESSQQQHGLRFISDNVAHCLPYIWKDGIRYGAKSNARTAADSLAFISSPDGSRTAAEILNLFVIAILGSGLLPHVCALIRRFYVDNNIPSLPWDLQYDHSCLSQISPLNTDYLFQCTCSWYPDIMGGTLS